MSEETSLSKAELLAKIAAGWDDLQSYLAGLEFNQVVAPSDPAGWTPKDHLVHLAIWEDGLNAALDGKPQWEYMGVPQDRFDSGDWDAINAIIQQRYHDLPLGDGQQLFFDIHARLVAKLEAMSEADLARLYSDYQPGSPYHEPIRDWFVIVTYPHYAEHKGYSEIIIQNHPDATLSKDQLLALMKRGWNDFDSFMSQFSEAQITQPTDAAGWTVKDHVAHLARWEDGIWALLNSQPRNVQMGVPDDLWAQNDYDAINAALRDLDKDLTLEQVRQHFSDVHERLIAKIEALSDADLQLPYEHYRPGSGMDKPVIGWISGNTHEHYAEHKPWITAIAEKG